MGVQASTILRRTIIPVAMSIHPVRPRNGLVNFTDIGFNNIIVSSFGIISKGGKVFLKTPSGPSPTDQAKCQTAIQVPSHTARRQVGTTNIRTCRTTIRRLITQTRTMQPTPVGRRVTRTTGRTKGRGTTQPTPTGTGRTHGSQ